MEKVAVSLTTSPEEAVGSSKSRRKLDPVDPELKETTNTTTQATDRQRRQAVESSGGCGGDTSGRQAVAVNATDGFSSVLLSKSPAQFDQSAQLLG